VAHPILLALQEVEDDDDITSSDEAPDLDDDGGFGAAPWEMSHQTADVLLTVAAGRKLPSLQLVHCAVSQASEIVIDTPSLVLHA
jgi:hypothetical protein